MYDEKKKSVLKDAVASTKMVDVGQKMDSMMGPIKASSKNKKYYPHMRLSAKEVPFLHNCEVGEVKRFVIEAVLTSKEIWEDDKGADKADYGFEIKKVGLSK